MTLHIARAPTAVARPYAGHRGGRPLRGSAGGSAPCSSLSRMRFNRRMTDGVADRALYPLTLGVGNRTAAAFYYSRFSELMRVQALL